MLDEKLIEHAAHLLRLDPDNVHDARLHPNNSRVGRAMWITLGKRDPSTASLYEDAVQEALNRLGEDT
jgi:hypothetical protein